MSSGLFLDCDELENQRRRDLAVRAICEDYCKKILLFNLCDFAEGECPLANLAEDLLAPGYSSKYADLHIVSALRRGD
jgi:hypothetical protein